MRHCRRVAGRRVIVPRSRSPTLRVWSVSFLYASSPRLVSLRVTMSKSAKFAEYKRAREGGGRAWKVSDSRYGVCILTRQNYSPLKIQIYMMKSLKTSTRKLSKDVCNEMILS